MTRKVPLSRPDRLMFGGLFIGSVSFIVFIGIVVWIYTWGGDG